MSSGFLPIRRRLRELLLDRLLLLKDLLLLLENLLLLRKLLLLHRLLLLLRLLLSGFLLGSFLSRGLLLCSLLLLLDRLLLLLLFLCRLFLLLLRALGTGLAFAVASRRGFLGDDSARSGSGSGAYRSAYDCSGRAAYGRSRSGPGHRAAQSTHARASALGCGPFRFLTRVRSTTG